MNCPQCQKLLTQVGSFWVCPEHGTAKPEVAPAQPTDSEKVRLFLSYGRRDAKDLAEHLVADLQAQGYEVWQDTRRIRSGREWEEEIQDGLRSTQIVVALLSPHAVRVAHDPNNPDNLDSVCLDEISFARFAQPPKQIIPVMARPCKPPFCIFRLDYVDLCAWKESEECYRRGLARLLESIEAVVRGEPPRYRSWDDRLKPWDFAPFLAEKRRDFCGRQWLFEEIEAWRRLGREPALLITGDPGVGKSAIVAELVHRNPGGQILAYHCCQADTPETLQPNRLVHSLAAMIASELTDYADKLSEPAVEEALDEVRCEDDPASALEEGILIPLHSLPAPEEGIRYLLVDALDEALQLKTLEGQKNIVEVLAARLRRWPPWLRIVATTRKDPRVLNALSAVPSRELRADDPRNQADLAQYIDRRLQADRLAKRQAAAGLAVDLNALLRHKSGGNFLYVKQALDGVEAGIYNLPDLYTLPPGLRGLYRDFFRRHFPLSGGSPPPSYHAARKILEVVVAAQEPLDVQQLVHVARLERDYDTPALLRLLAVYLPEREGRVRLFHKSLGDWLTDRTQEYYVDPRRGHAGLAEACRAVFLRRAGLPDTDALALLPDEVGFRPYVFRHGVRHLVQAGQYAVAVELLHHLRERPDVEGHPGAAQIEPLARLLAVSLCDCPADEARRILPRKLAGLLTGIENFEPLYGALRLLYRHHLDQWDSLVAAFLKSEEWVFMYACSLVLADGFFEQPSAEKFASIRALIRSPEVLYQELGAYTIKLMCQRKPDLFTAQVADEVAGTALYEIRGILGELLLYLTLNGHREAQQLVSETSFWEPLWDYNRMYLDELLAAEQFLRARPAPSGALPPGAADNYRYLLETESNRLELMESEEVRREPSLRAVLESYYRLPIRLEALRRGQEALERSFGLKPILKLLLANPFWEVCEAVASVASNLAETRPEVIELAREMLYAPNWRLRYSAMELVLLICHLDDQQTIVEAISHLSKDGHCWVRGICAECMTGWLLNSPSEKLRSRVGQVEGAIQAFLVDEDIWVLEEMYDLFTGLREAGIDVTPLLAQGVTPLLQGEPQWYQLRREEFLWFLEAEKRKHYTGGD